MLRISDSLAFGATARHVFAVINDRDNKRKLFVRAKNNLARHDIGALAYTFDTKPVGWDKTSPQEIRAPHIVWHNEHVDIDASDAIAATAGTRNPAAREDAKRFLTEALKRQAGFN